MKYTVGIIGLGNIGMMYDYSSPKEVFLTHFKSFNAHDDFDLTLCVDRSISQLNLAKMKLSGSSVEYLTDWTSITSFPDVLVLASTPQVNQEVFESLYSKESIKIFLVEKPFWSDSWDFNKFSKVKSKVVVNYIRKFIPEVQEIKNEIISTSLGTPLKVHAWYSKGLRNNGSHLLDLMCYLLGATEVNYKDIHTFDEVDDYLEQDKSIGFSLKLKMDDSFVGVVFQPVDERLFSIIEMDILFTHGRIRFHDFGFTIDRYSVDPDLVFKGYSNLNFKHSKIINKENYMMNVLNNLVEILEGKESNNFGLEQEFKVSQLLKLIKNNHNHEIK